MADAEGHQLRAGDCAPHTISRVDSLDREAQKLRFLRLTVDLRMLYHSRDRRVAPSRSVVLWLPHVAKPLVLLGGAVGTENAAVC